MRASCILQLALGNIGVSGGGANIWGAADSFYYAWRRAGGDLTLTADVAFEGTGGDPHRKAGWMVRGDLSPDAAYADAVVHGDGLVALQYRPARGAETQEVRDLLNCLRAIDDPVVVRQGQVDHRADGHDLRARPRGGVHRR